MLDDSPNFLFVDWLKPFDEESDKQAIIFSPIYQDSASECVLNIDYYIAGYINSPAITVSVRVDDEDFPIDFLHDESATIAKFKHREIGIGRRLNSIEVCS